MRKGSIDRFEFEKLIIFVFFSRHLFALMCKTEPLETFMEFYDKLVPNIYTPEPGVMVELLRAIELNNAIDLIPRIWSDMIMFDHTDRENLITLVLQIMTNANLSPENPDLDKYVKVAWDVYTKINEQPEHRTQRLAFTGEILGNILSICSLAKDFEKADIVMQTLIQKQNSIIQIPAVVALEGFLDLCIEEKKPTKAIGVIQYAVDLGYSEGGLMGKRLMEKLTLNEDDVNKLINIVGKDVLQIKEAQISG